jgi:hypothetical protein
MTTLDYRKYFCTVCNIDLHDWVSHLHINTPAHLKCAQYAFDNRIDYYLKDRASFIYDSVIKKKEVDEQKVKAAEELIKHEIRCLKMDNEHLEKN